MIGRRSIGLIAALVVAGAGVAVLWLLPETRGILTPPRRAPVPILVSGNIEAHESVLSVTQVQAPIVELPFDEGASVDSGTVLARLDDRLYRQQVEIDRASLGVAAAQVAANESSLIAARSDVASDRSDHGEKLLDYGRAERLLGDRAGTQQARDLALTAERQSAAALARDEAMVQVAGHNVALAEANRAAAQARLDLDAITLSYTVLRAPFAGVISVRHAELGQLAGPGVPIFTLDDLDHPWLRAYVNEPDIGTVRLGEPVAVTTDAYPHHTYRGRISFISPEAEFTPKTVETHAERVTLVYRIRIDIDNPSHELLPGMPADATIAALPPGQP